MATRFYFSSTAVPLKSPGFAAYTRTSEGIRRTMSTVKDASSLTDTTFFANTSPAANDSALSVQFVSPPMQSGVAFVTTDTFSGIIKCQESGTNDNLNRLPMALKVYDKDGTTLRATLKALGHYGPNTTEWVSGTNSTKIIGNAVVLGANYTTAAGDLLVLEIGGQVSSSGGSTVTGTQNIGSSAASDFALTEALTTNLNPWFEISRTFGFLFTGSAAVTIGAVTASASGTFTKPVYSGTATLTVGAATESGSATFTEQARTGTAAVTIGAATASVSGTFTKPVYTGTASLGIGAATLSASGQFGYHPVGKIVQPLTGIWGKRYVTFAGKVETPPVYIATASLTIGAVNLTGSGYSYDYHIVGKIVQPRTGTWGRRYVSFVGKGSAQYTATATLTVGAATESGTATFAKPVYAGTGTLTTGHATIFAVGGVTQPVYTGAGALTAGPATASGTATFTKPTYTGASAVTIGHATFAGSAVFAAAVYVGTSAVVVGHATFGGVATFATPASSGSAALEIAAAVFGGTALLNPPLAPPIRVPGRASRYRVLGRPSVYVVREVRP